MRFSRNRGLLLLAFAHFVVSVVAFVFGVSEVLAAQYDQAPPAWWMQALEWCVFATLLPIAYPVMVMEAVRFWGHEFYSFLIVLAANSVLAVSLVHLGAQGVRMIRSKKGA